jgi:hypothetical protein
MVYVLPSADAPHLEISAEARDAVRLAKLEQEVHARLRALIG